MIGLSSDAKNRFDILIQSLRVASEQAERLGLDWETRARIELALATALNLKPLERFER